MMNHKRLPKFEDCETIERLTGGDYLAVRNLIAYSSTEKGIILKDLSNGESRPVSGGGKGERRPVFSPDGTTFYAREGFVNDGVRKAFYQDPKEDAVLMSLEIDK